MPDYTASDIRDEYRFPVEELSVRRYAEAAWDANPRYRYSGDTASIAVPPMFGCLAATLAGRSHSLEVLGFDVARSFHGEETILLYAPLIVGTTLTVTDATLRLPDVMGRRGGVMRRARRRSILADERGNVVGVVTRTLLEAADPLVSSVPTGDTRVFDDGLRVRTDPVVPDPIPARCAAPGRSLAEGRFGPITRADFVRYAVASADLTAIHYDENAARSRGYQTTFAMGMLSAALIGHMVTDWFSLDCPWRLSMRFSDQIWPGDVLVVSGEVVSADDEKVTVSSACSSDRGLATTALLEQWLPGATPPGPDDY
ncbi:FAS1-like dehydratase domain-containing protein [Compostimonas suwonensis]|uniref:MaoC family dehydratase n=1 Tax=Compostimonas suwonensis TaxID=1048394 RepID=UPI001473E924|nr:MaoC family dehydratase N-terminal domain-containing protein [Compostimonas suwonensis]